MQRTPYQKADEAAAKITSKIHKEFRHNRLALFDELNIVGVKKHINKLHKKIFKIIKSEFLAVANDIYAEAFEEAIALGFDGDLGNIDEWWVEEFFKKYSPVTKYVFTNELERKLSRLFEALISNLEERLESYQTTESLIIRQIKQNAIEFEDKIVEETYQTFGVKKVQWVAEKDHKTCGDCKEMDGEVFGIEEAPPKLHHHCRCYYIPVKE